MIFKLYNEPATFQRAMMAILSNKVEKFMDDFLVFRESYDCFFFNLVKVLQWCVETNLILNWENFHFMVKEIIMLGHKVSIQGIEMDRAKIKAFEKWPPLTSMKSIQSFLDHVGFYIIFIKDFSNIPKPLCMLLKKDVPFMFNKKCIVAFQPLKSTLISTSVIITLY